MKKGLRTGIIITVITALVLGAGGGAWYYYGHNSSEPVYVYDMNVAGMTDFWGDTRECYGPVSTDRIQTVFLTETQTVTEIKVSEGDMVKKGDLLMTFDTTLSDIALERKKLAVDKLTLQLEDAKIELQRINAMRPMSKPVTPVENLGSPLEGSYMIGDNPEYDGATADTAIVCWVADSTAINDELLEAVRQRAEDIQNENIQAAYEESLLNPTEPEEGEEGEEEPTPPAPPAHVTVDSYYAVFKMTVSNMSLGGKLAWQGLHVYRNSAGFVFKFFDGTGINDYLLSGEEQNVQNPTVDYGSGYTLAEIQQMRADQQKTIKDLEFQLKMAEGAYTIMQKEMADGNIYAETDGKVISLLDPEEAKFSMQPVLKVSGGGGFYIEGSVSELERDELAIGQEVTINDWETGSVYTGTITQIRDFPNGQSGWNGNGNPNVTYFPFTVFVDESADLRAGYYVNIQYASAGQSDTFYLRNPFIRTEQGVSYVLVRNAEGRLEKRIITTGKNLWGNYTEVKSGLSLDDKVAFPYGKTAKVGAKTQDGDYNTLYEG